MEGDDRALVEGLFREAAVMVLVSLQGQGCRVGVTAGLHGMERRRSREGFVATRGGHAAATQASVPDAHRTDTRVLGARQI
jgi:hypothetical protein